MTLLSQPPRRFQLGGLFFCGVLVACAPLRYEVASDSLPDVIRDYGAGELELRNSDSQVMVGPERDPQLRLELVNDCSFWENLSGDCDAMVEGALASAEQLDGSVRLVSEPEGDRVFAQTVDVALTEIETAYVLVEEYSAQDWEPDWGVGLMLLGPAGAFGFDLQYFPIPEFAFDGGLFAVTHFATVYGGGRLRPFDWGPARPYVGGVVMGMTAADVDYNVYNQVAYGPRLGIDFRFGRGHVLWGIEAEMLYLSNENNNFFAGMEGPWVPWGGTRVSYVF